jgi:hypothetical protein
MATLRNSTTGAYLVGNTPPEITWTVVRGDTSAFTIYVTDDLLAPLYVPEWDIQMDIKRNGLAVVSLVPVPTPDPDQLGDYKDGDLTVSLTSTQSNILETGDVFDIQMTNESLSKVWTVAKGSVIVIEDITKSV